MFRTFGPLQLIPLGSDLVLFRLFSTYVFSLHHINLHLFACRFVFSSHECIVLCPQLKYEIFEGRNHAFGFFCISHSTFYCAQQRVGVQYMLWNDILSDPSLAGPKIKFPDLEQS